MATRRRPERWVVGIAVLLLHLAGLWAWPPTGSAARDAARSASLAPVVVRLLSVPMPPMAIAVPTRPPSLAPAARTRPASPPLAGTHPAAASVVAATSPASDVQQSHVPPATESSASGPAPLDLRLHLPRGVAAERGGLAEAPDSMRRAALNDPRSNVRADPTQTLPQAVASAAKGDCTKGEFVGGGMGLLSLPFLAAAVIRDACRPAR